MSITADYDTGPAGGRVRVIGLAGWSGSGKTTLLTRLLPELIGRGLRVSTVKHAHHGFDIDVPGKDSWRHREAGAIEVMVSAGRRWALMHEVREEPEPGLATLLARLSPVDLVVVEGFSHAGHPRIEVFRAATGKPPLYPNDPGIVAVASDVPLAGARVPVIALADIAALADAAIARAAALA